MKIRFPLVLVFLGILALSSAALGEGSGESKKSLDFEGELVEGMNRRPLDSLTAISEGKKDRSKNHQYNRKKSFVKDNRQLALEIVETY